MYSSSGLLDFNSFSVEGSKNRDIDPYRYLHVTWSAKRVLIAFSNYTCLVTHNLAFE